MEVDGPSDSAVVVLKEETKEDSNDISLPASLQDGDGAIVDQSTKEPPKKKKKSSSLRCQYRCPIRLKNSEERQKHYDQVHAGQELPILTCDICGKSGFRWECTLKQHINDCHFKDNVLFICEFCEKIFTRRDSYKEHLLIHNGPRHKCSFCDKQFVQRSNLIRHERIHTGTKPYQCSFCDAKFSDQGACKSHENIHTRLQTCVCTYCGQQFSKQQKLRYHLRKHTGEGLVTCPICQKTFTNSSALRSHLLTHSKNKTETIPCPYQCGRMLSNEKNLRKHVQHVHEKTNLAQCPICNRILSAHTSLKSHMIVHTGVKHIVCLVCKKGYSELPGFRYHLLSKHNIPRKHQLFSQCYYKLTLKEIGIMERFIKSKKGKKNGKLEDDEEEELTVTDAIENFTKPTSDSLPEGEGLFESILTTEETETVTKGGKTYIIAPEKGIPLPEFYEISAESKEMLDKKINEKSRNLQTILKDFSSENIKTKQTKLKKNEIKTEFITVTGGEDRVREFVSETGCDDLESTELDDGTVSVHVPAETFSSCINKVLFHYYTTKKGTRMIKLSENNFKIDNRGRPKGSKKDIILTEAEMMGLDIVTVKGNSDKVTELYGEIIQDGVEGKLSEVIWLEGGGHVLKAERAELVNILDKSHPDSYITMNGIKLLFVDERTFKIDSRGRRRNPEDANGADYIGHMNNEDEDMITVTGVRKNLEVLAKEFVDEPYVDVKKNGFCCFHVSKTQFKHVFEKKSKNVYVSSENGIKIKKWKERNFRIDSRGRKKRKKSSSEGGDSESEENENCDNVRDQSETEDLEPQLVRLVGRKDHLIHILSCLNRSDCIIKDEDSEFVIELPTDILVPLFDTDRCVLKLQTCEIVVLEGSGKFYVVDIKQTNEEEPGEGEIEETRSEKEETRSEKEKEETRSEENEVETKSEANDGNMASFSFNLF